MPGIRIIARGLNTDSLNGSEFTGNNYNNGVATYLGDILFALVHGGAPGSDAGLTFNLPLVTRKLALRGFCSSCCCRGSSKADLF